MTKFDSTITQRVAEVANVFQEQRTGRAPIVVTAVLSEDALVVTLREALTPAEKALAWTPEITAQVQPLHQHLFTNSSEFMRPENSPITDRHVREAVTEIETAMGTVVNALTNGAMVQVLRLVPDVLPDTSTASDSIVAQNI
ncbi:MAG: DUF2294 family protein [Planctomycetaceae bacterium]|nr:DUF2294 family protein [Planctomycetaceae bacterium]